MTTFLLTFALSILLVGFPQPQATTKVYKIYDQPLREQILRFLEQDRQNGRDMEKDLAELRKKEINSPANEAQVIEKLLDKMREMSAAEFPFDFQKAWQNHIEAWRSRADLLKETGIINNSETTDKEFSQKYGQTHQDISETYNKLLKVAQKYGVSFSYYAN